MSKRSRRITRSRPPGRRALVGDLGNLAGAPVYASYRLMRAYPAPGGPATLILGVGEQGKAPAAYLALDPVDDVADLVGALIDVAADAHGDGDVT